MKYSKKIIAVLCLCLASCGKNKNTTIDFNGHLYNLEESNDVIKFAENISRIISNQEITYQLNFIEKREEFDEISQKNYFFILLNDINNQSNIGILLNLEEIEENIHELDRRIVICSGLENCNPILVDDNWACDAELESYKCKKSVILF